MTKLSLFTIAIVWIFIFDWVSAYIEIEYQRLEQLNELTYIDYSKVFFRKVNRTRKLFGNMTVHVPFDNNDMGTASFYVKQGGEYRLMPYRLPKKGFCDFLKESNDFYKELTENSNMPFPAPCPYPAGVYTYYGYAPSLTELPLPLLQNGDYAVEWLVHRDSQLRLKIKFYAGIINI